MLQRYNFLLTLMHISSIIRQNPMILCHLLGKESQGQVILMNQKSAPVIEVIWSLRLSYQHFPDFTVRLADDVQATLEL